MRTVSRTHESAQTCPGRFTPVPIRGRANSGSVIRFRASTRLKLQRDQPYRDGGRAVHGAAIGENGEIRSYQVALESGRWSRR